MVIARGHCVFKHWWMRGLKKKESILADDKCSATEKFKKELRWSDDEEWFDCGNVGILAYAVAGNEFHVVSELLKYLKREYTGEEYTRRVDARLRDRGYVVLGIPGGMTTLMAAMMISQSTKWKLIRGCAKLAVRCRLVKSALANRLAHGAGLTALHYAARRGDVEIVDLLLKHGADPYIENEMGLNSFDITKKSGPFPSVTKALRKLVRQ